MKKLILLTLMGLMPFFSSFAQSSNQVEMADFLRSSGKIYVVVLVVSLILVGFIVYLFTIDRKVSKLEKQQRNKL